MTDFLGIARPLLDTLKDDPNRGPPEIESTIAGPLDYRDFDEDVVPLERHLEDWPIDDIGAVTVENTQAAEDVFSEVGIDVLAFYKSFRFTQEPPFKGKWGIFLIDAGIASVAARFRAQMPVLRHQVALQLAADTLYEHERYHFWIDAWALGQECLPVGNRVKRYEYYLAKRALVALTAGDVEESLANRFTFGRLGGRILSGKTSARKLLRSFFSACPVPYSRFDLSGVSLRQYEGYLMGGIANGIPYTARAVQAALLGEDKLAFVWAPSIRPDVREYPLHSPDLCPVFLIRDSGYATRVHPFQGPERGEFRRFVENYLNGEPQKRTDHEFYRIDNGEKIKFPNPHVSRIKGHEFTNVLLKAGMRRPEFVKEQQRTKTWKKQCPRPEPKPPLSD